MNIELNNTNCTELTSNEFEAKVNELNSNLDFDLDGFFDEIEEEEEEEEEENIEITAEQKKWLAEIAKYEALLEDWSKRTYKKTKSTTYIGTELDGGNYSYGYINELRRNKNVKNFISYIAEYKEFLKESGYNF